MAHGVYRNAAGKRLPSVTTLLSRYKDPEPLVRWANKLGLEGINALEFRDDAASAGSLAHEYIEADIQSREPKIPTEEEVGRPFVEYLQIMTRARRSYDNFVAWKKQVSLEVIATETPLSSEIHQYGGCLDAVLLISGVPTMYDWKTSKGVYPEYLMQVAAYRELWRESGGVDTVGGAELLRIDRETAAWNLHSWTNAQVDPAFDSFIARLKAYRCDAITRAAFANGVHTVGLGETIDTEETAS